MNNAELPHLSEGVVTGCTFSDGRFVCHVTDALMRTKDCGEEHFYAKTDIIMTGTQIKSIEETARRVLNIKESAPKDIEKRRLYKSEHERFMSRLSSEEWLIFELSAAVTEKGTEVFIRIYFTEDGALYDMTLRCEAFDTVPKSEGITLPRPKLTLRQRAAAAKIEVTAVFYAMSRRETPAAAKVIAALAVGYAMSPIDLIPDFIPVLGRLDDLLILPGLIFAAVRLIPPEIMEECRLKASETRLRLPKKWFYALPVIIIWILIIVLIIILI